jgi:imidazolonepropionase-like amidohydrolase
MNPSRCLLLLAGLALSACTSHKLLARVTLEPTSSRAYLISNVNVFDGDTALGARDVRIKDGKVLEVAEAGTLQPSPGDEQLAGAGLTLMPGLIDSHAHFESHGEPIWGIGLPELDDIAQAYVYSGVTTTLVMTGNEEQRKLEHRAEAGELVAPRLYRTGPRLTAPEGFPMNLMRALLVWPLSNMVINSVMRSATTGDEARAAVNETADELAPPFYKITSDSFPPGAPKLTTEALTAAIQQAKARNMRSAAHVGAPEDVLIAAEAGLSIFAHPPSSAVFTAEQIARLAELKVPFVSTQRFLTSPNHLAADKGTPLDREIITPKMLEQFSQRPKDFKYPMVPPEMDADKLLAKYEQNLRENVLALWKAGVPIFVGTDAGSPGVIPGSSLQRELSMLVAAGIPAVDVLKAATSAPADFLDSAHSYGRVAVGQRADLLLVKGDPTADVAAVGSIVEVFQAGRRLKRSVAAP